MKKRFLFVFALLSALMITGCKDNNKKAGTLSAPQEVVVQSDGNKSLIIFDEVKNAQYYNIYINDTSVTVKGDGSGTVHFDASKIITSPQKYIIKVKAGSDKYFDSNFSSQYEYQHTSILASPIISIDGTTLNWDKVPNAQYYDILVASSNPTVQTTHRFSTNQFNFANLLTHKGEYSFKVCAVSDSSEYISSIYSNELKYTHTITLTTPHNLSTNYDVASGEMLLTFVSSENVSSFTINVDGISYTITQNELNNFLYSDDIDNVYVIKLTSFLRHKNIEISNTKVFNIGVKANASGDYLKSSQFSNTISCQFATVLATPQIQVATTGTNCQITISATSSPYLSGYAIYLNDKKYKTFTKDITEIELPLVQIGLSGIRVQAISNNNNCYSSKLSDVKYVDDSLTALEDINITYENNAISWDVNGASIYYVEITNAIFKYAEFTTETSLDLATLLTPNSYQVRVVAMADGYKQSEKVIDIEYSNTLAKVENVTISTIGDSTYVEFDEVAGAYGYVIYLDGVMVDRLFTTNMININSYINNGKQYTIQVQAISIANNFVVGGELSQEQILQSVETLSAPILTITKDLQTNKYYLNINVDENESAMASGYELWINYTLIGNEPFQDTKLDITSYLANAGDHHFMVKAKAIDSNPYINDSIITSITYTSTKQLDRVTDIKVTELSGEGTYILTFKQQELAVKYLVTIEKLGNDGTKQEFEINSGVADISEYVKDNGVYKIDVEALPLEGSPYTRSGGSGNPYRLTKGKTLPLVDNVLITKRTSATSNGIVEITWNKVENCEGYQVYIYYNQYGKNVLRKSVYVAQSDSPSLDIGSGEHVCLNKEGSYTIQIKALGDGENFETSQLKTIPYEYSMETKADFERNTIFMYGNTYSYRVKTVEDLKHLLWYHYLYNQDVWKYNTLDYNLKIYCDSDINKFAQLISESLADEVAGVVNNAQKMSLVARQLLKQYPEIGAWSLGAGNEVKFCLNEQPNIFIIRYQSVLEDDKLKQITTTDQVFNEKLDVIDTFDQRSSNYIFAIDTQESVDVTTTEQLFMALQYNRKPNFVGDCEVAKAVYENARLVLRQICSDAMNEYEKTLQIYNFLTKRIVYNNNAEIGNASNQITLEDGSVTLRGNIKDFYLEGVLYNAASENGLFTSVDQFVGQTAVCDGLAKAFVVLCSIEGIDSIKVKNSTHAWNKVYLDLENDGITGKQWYAIDLTRAIKYDVMVNRTSTSYQVGLHRFFLVPDTYLESATSWHKPLGDKTNYVASTNYDYYETERYSCVYNGNTIVDNKNFKAKTEEEVKNALMYAMLKANKKHRIVVDINAETYITSITGGTNTQQALNAIISRITSTVYEAARTELGGMYNCELSVGIMDNKYIVLAVEAV